MRKKLSRLCGMILCICMVMGLFPAGFMVMEAKAEVQGEVQYVRIKCHNADVNYYMAVSESDQTKPYAAVNKDYGWDYTVWIVEEETDKAGSGNKIVKLKNYATKSYIGITGGQLAMIEADENNENPVKWEVEIKNDHEGAWQQNGPMIDWNRYKPLNGDSGQYLCTEGLNNQEGNLVLSQGANDDWWSNEWKYETVAAEELINQPGDTATEEEKGALSGKIEAAKAVLADAESYHTKSLRNLETVVATAEKVYQYDKATGTTVNAQIAAVDSAVEGMARAEDSKLYAQGEMAIAGQAQIGDKGEYYLDFAEEFNDATLNSDVWLDEYLPHWAKNEEDSKARYEIRDGKLALQVRKGDQPWSPENDGQVICSGITTFNKNYFHNFSGHNKLFEHKDSNSTDNNYFNGYTTQYGYIEMRAKLEDDGGQGHQALWLVGTQDDADNWADSKRTAEIDMLETSFYDSYKNWRLCGYGWNDSNFCPNWNTSDREAPSGDPGKEYHTYGMEWTPEKLNFYYDGEYYRSIDYSPKYAMGIILSIYQNAGWSTGNRESGPAWPKEMLVDYLRVYKPVGGYDNGYVDTKALEKALEQAKGEAAKEDIYTADSKKNLEEAIKNAEAAVKNEKVTKEEILQQMQALQESVNGLENKPGEGTETDPGNKPGDGTETDPGNKPGNGTETDPGNKPGEGTETNPGNKPGDGTETDPGNKPGAGTGSETDSENKPGSNTGTDPGNQQDKTVKVEKIEITGLTHKIHAGKKITLKAKVFPSNATVKGVTWQSSNTKVATVNKKGIVKLKKNTGGKTVTITAKANDGSKVIGRYKLISMKGVVKKIQISGAKPSVKAGKSLKLKAKVTASKGANKQVVWTSSNEKYAKVSASGKVMAYKAGKGKKVKITAKAVDGSGKKKTVTIKIK